MAECTSKFKIVLRGSFLVEEYIFVVANKHAGASALAHTSIRLLPIADVRLRNVLTYFVIARHQCLL